MLNPETTWGYDFGTVTLVGVGPRVYPLEYGNCFSVHLGDNRYVNIVNFVFENLEHLLETKVIEWPIKVILIGDRTAVINDPRIPDDYYSKRFCEVCTPLDLLPIPQRLKHLRDIDRGEREERDSVIIYKIKRDPSRKVFIND